MKRVLMDPSPTLSSSVWSGDFVDFVAQCLNKDENARPSADALLSVRVGEGCDG